MSTPNPFIEGISDAVGFVGGALAGFWVGQWLGWNIFSAGYGMDSIGGILLVGLGGGGGLHLARYWRAKRTANDQDTPS
jgi:hypothetical protein